MTDRRPSDDTPRSSMPRQFRHRPSRRVVADADALPRLFAACCESAFTVELGVADPPVVDYMTDLLMRFLHCDEFQRFRSPTGQTLASVPELLIEAEDREGPARSAMLRHVGDVTLFWTGVYPEALPRVQRDQVIDLPACGQRSYRLASGGEAESVLGRIADEYAVCRDGLHRARLIWEDLRN